MKIFFPDTAVQQHPDLTVQDSNLFFPYKCMAVRRTPRSSQRKRKIFYHPKGVFQMTAGSAGNEPASFREYSSDVHLTLLPVDSKKEKAIAVSGSTAIRI